MHGRRLESDLASIILAELGDELAVMGLDALEALEEVDVKEGAAKLAVGNPLQAHILLGAHDFANARVLDCVQLGGGEAAGGETLARFPQPLGAKETADMVGAKWRTGHGSSLKALSTFSLSLNVVTPVERLGNHARTLLAYRETGGARGRGRKTPRASRQDGSR